MHNRKEDPPLLPVREIQESKVGETPLPYQAKPTLILLDLDSSSEFKFVFRFHSPFLRHLLVGISSSGSLEKCWLEPL